MESIVVGPRGFGLIIAYLMMERSSCRHVLLLALYLLMLAVLTVSEETEYAIGADIIVWMDKGSIITTT